YLMALDPANGEILWKTDRSEYLRGFATPVVHRPPDGEPQIVLPGSFGVAGYALGSGKKLWWARGLAWQVKTVAVTQGNLIYAHGWASGGDAPARDELPGWEQVLADHDTDGNGAITPPEAFLERMKSRFGSYDLDKNGRLSERDWNFARAKHSARNALMAVRTDGRGDVTNTHVVWRHRKPLPNVASPLLYEDVIYLAKDGGIFSSVDASTGELLKVARLPGAMGRYYASPIAGDGKVYAVDADGMLTVIRAGAEWEILSANEMNAPVYATPAIADGRIYVRTAEHLYCFGE
ncbi:MAG: PQQ-binding-like beta-propeller repeat protein, partial [bacterium]|nr:PQQ-binding-like beta-propeller repeat protein [bacterium]